MVIQGARLFCFVALSFPEGLPGFSAEFSALSQAESEDSVGYFRAEVGKLHP